MGHTDKDDVALLKRGLRELFEHIHRIRQEIASIRHPGTTDGEDRFTQISDELDAIVSSTETATETIMENAERIELVVSKVAHASQDPEIKTALGTINGNTAAIFEACAFQDITGQRVTKIVKTLLFVEERINTLIYMWGQDAVNRTEAHAPIETDADKKLLSGPQLAGQGVSQHDVDVFFDDQPALKQNDIDGLLG